MKKGGIIFAKIIYYIFTFGLGVLFVFILPNAFKLSALDGGTEVVYATGIHLSNGDYDKAIALAGGYYYKTPVVEEVFDENSGFVLFAAQTLTYSDAEGAVNNKLQDSYAGFLYGVADTYNINGAGAQSRVRVTDKFGESKVKWLLNYDNDGDGAEDSNATMLLEGFIMLDLDKATYNSLRKIEFIDANGNVFKTLDTQLDYTERFFADVADLQSTYNEWIEVFYARQNGAAGMEQRLQDLEKNSVEFEKSFLAKDGNYLKSSSEFLELDEIKEIRRTSDIKAAFAIVGYFLFIYILADFIFGSLYLVKGTKWVLVHVFKVKFKQRTPKYDEVFGNDYYCQLTISLDVSSLDNFSESVQIRYDNEKGEGISFILLKQNNYTVTQRVKAGTYVNLWIDIDKNIYATVNLPETLVVEGYQKGYKVKILRREE